MNEQSAGEDVPSAIEPELADLAAAYGVATGYWDWRGQYREVARTTIETVLAALDIDVSTPEATRHAFELYQQTQQHTLPPCVVAREGQRRDVSLCLQHEDEVEVSVEREDGQIHRLTAQRHSSRRSEPGDGQLEEATFRLPELPTGYHQLHAVTAQGTETVSLIVTPARLALESWPGEQRQWGFAVQLYSVRSRDSWGLGDLVDLAELARWSGRDHGAGMLLVNPLYAGEPTVPLEPSPYLPTSRRYISPLYLRIEAVPEYAELDFSARAYVEELAAPLRASNHGAQLLDRDAVWQAKLAAADRLRGVPRSPEREAAYQQYVAGEGQPLTDFATWCALAERYGANWRSWPAELQNPASAAVHAAREEYADRVDLYRYLQWLLDEQLASAQLTATEAGMPVGVVHDLPVGVHPRGADAWALRDVLAAGVSVGAPPDPFNQLGQDWSQPPWRPDRLAERGYAPWRDLVRSVLRHGRGLRVDHVVGLFRLWWVPEGQSPLEGTYVSYDYEAMVGILALEAQRAGAVVIGEDLGTVEPWARELLEERGILGTNVAWFEYADDGNPRPPEQWRRNCLATVTVHDLPPTAAQWEGAHIRLRDELGVLTQPTEQVWADFAHERTVWLRALAARGWLPDPLAQAVAEHTSRSDGDSDAPAPPISQQMIEEYADHLVYAMHRWVAATPARLVGVALTDAVGERRTQNQPGTHREYPNWQFPLCDSHGRPVLLEDLRAIRSIDRLTAIVRGL